MSSTPIAEELATPVDALTGNHLGGPCRCHSAQAIETLLPQFTAILGQATGRTPVLTPSRTNIPCGGIEGSEFSSIENGYIFSQPFPSREELTVITATVTAAFQSAGWHTTTQPNTSDGHTAILISRVDPKASAGIGITLNPNTGLAAIYGRFDINCLPAA